jgi:hypothetical protein
MDKKVFYNPIRIFCARVSSRLTRESDELAPDQYLSARKLVQPLEPLVPYPN